MDRCTGCGLPFPIELQQQLRRMYQPAMSDLRVSDLLPKKRGSATQPARATSGNDATGSGNAGDAIPVAQVDRLFITDRIQPTMRQRWAQSLPARICLRAGFGLSLWSLLVCVLGPLALIPAVSGFFLSLISVSGFERKWALLGLLFSVCSITIVFVMIEMQTIS